MLYSMLRSLYPEYEGMSDTERYAVAERLLFLLQTDLDDNTRNEVEQRIMFLHGKLALHVYRQAQHRFASNPRIDDDDLEQAAFEGLLSAIRSFDPSLNYRFSTYAIKVIQSNINRLEHQLGTDLYISHAALTLMHRVRMYLHSDEELKERIDREAEEDQYWTEGTLRSIFRIFTASVVSLYRRVYNNRMFVEDVISNEEPTVEEQAIEAIQSDYYKQLLKENLTSTEFDILARYCGLFGYDQLSLSEIAELHGVSRQAIHQAKNKIMRRIRELLWKEFDEE